VNRVLGILATALPVIIALALIVLGRFRPGYFTNEHLVGAVFLQLLALSLWFYDQLFFPLLMISFLWAGMELPMTGSWGTLRWVVLGAGALVGFIRSMRLGRQRYHPFLIVSFFCVASALVSAMVSALPGFSALKALSLFLLFLYGSAGARLVLRDQDRFFRGLLLACEISVYATGVCYFVLRQEIWGNANSMGAVEGVVAAPLLLWGALVAPRRNLQIRRAVACAGAFYLVYFSAARAALLAMAVAIALLMIGLRRQKLLIQGLVVAGGVLAFTGIAATNHFEDLKTSFTDGVIYKGHRGEGLLASRLTPWQETVGVIQEHPYFGSGFGTSVSQDRPFGEARTFISTAFTNREHGSSFLAIVEWMGLVGIIPFVVLVFLVILTIARVFLWMRRTGNPAHYSIPIMIVLAAGLTHAVFEDWLFAVGYHLTILFWSFAFLLMDLAPQVPERSAIFVHGMRFPVSSGTVPLTGPRPLP
jgi:O-antigen ligase